jgi:hypothetical protein
MNLTRVVHIIRWFVPLAIVVLGAGDCYLALRYGEPATYTAIIRSWFYACPFLTILLPTVIGALWAHFFWNPGAEIEALKYDLRRQGACYLEERSRFLDGRYVYCVYAGTEDGKCSGGSEWLSTPKDAWLVASHGFRASLLTAART